MSPQSPARATAAPNVPPQCRPFLRWAGGKTRFLQMHGRTLPKFDGQYLEPFMGAGAVFFSLASGRVGGLPARLGDVNRHLVRCYLDLRDDPDRVAERLTGLAAGFAAASDKAEFYYEVRKAHNSRHPDYDSAAFIFLNRTCWNGLWRVNQKGKFNVPFGALKGDLYLPTQNDLRAVSAALQSASIRCTPWENTIAFAEPGDFVFLDPPYFSDLARAEGRTVTKYHEKAFSFRDYVALAERMRALSQRGVNFLLTNSAEPEMVELYRGYGFSVREISIPRAINSRTDARHGVPEIVVTPGMRHGAEMAEAEVELELTFRARAFAHRQLENRKWSNDERQ